MGVWDIVPQRSKVCLSSCFKAEFNQVVEVRRLVRPSYTWIHGRTVAEDAGEELDLGHEPGGSSARPGPLRARPHVVAPAAALELEQPVPRACAGAAVQVVRRRAPVEAHCGCG